MRYIEITIKLPLADDETEEDATGLENLATRGTGNLLRELGRGGTYWAIRTADPVKPEPNIHDHRSVVKAAGGRHDHEPPPWGANHRHIGSIKSPPVPPIVVGCLGVGHNDIDCFAAEVGIHDRCHVCVAALGRSFR